jgi:hypothetical protein
MGVSTRGRVLSWDVTAEVDLEPEDLPGPVLQALAAYAPFDAIEVSFSVTGYDDPGIPTGLPEHGYPPEGDEERLLEGIRVHAAHAPWRQGDAVTFQKLEHDQFLLDKAYELELDYVPDEPDWDTIRQVREDRKFERARRLAARWEAVAHPGLSGGQTLGRRSRWN